MSVEGREGDEAGRLGWRVDGGEGKWKREQERDREKKRRAHDINFCVINVRQSQEENSQSKTIALSFRFPPSSPSLPLSFPFISPLPPLLEACRGNTTITHIKSKGRSRNGRATASYPPPNVNLERLGTPVASQVTLLLLLLLLLFPFRFPFLSFYPTSRLQSQPGTNQ